MNSTLAAALVAAKLGIPVAHVEAGLRSFDRSMPEEINRILTDPLSDLLFIHSPEARRNLLREGVRRRPDPRRRQHDDRHARGDAARASRRSTRPPPTASTPGAYLVVTLHRPALVDGPLLADAIAALDARRGGDPGRLPGPPADGAARWSAEASRSRRPACACSSRSATWSSSPPRGRRGRAHRLGRDPGGDDVPRHPVLHAARQHRAPGDVRSRDERAARPRARAHRRGPGADRGGARPARDRSAGLGRAAAAERIVDVLEAGVPEWEPPLAPDERVAAADGAGRARFVADAARRL